MPSGGARVRSGPPPDPNALRRNRKEDAEWVTLPAAGRAGDPPAFPLTDPNDVELRRWAELWAKPQAVQWDKQGLHYTVAMFVRKLGEAEVRDSSATLVTAVMRMQDQLGLTEAGMRAMRWRIGEPSKQAKTDAKADALDADSPASVRSRFRVIDGRKAG